MDWAPILTIILSILVPMITGFIWIISHMDRKFDDVQRDLRNIDSRLSKMEGRFEERGYWESRKTGTEEKKK